MKESLFIKALNGVNFNSRPPVWLMRQAGRYMPEYRAIREKYSFLQMCHEPELATKITLQPIKAFDMDAAILFSDILVIPEALNMGLHFDDGIGPIIDFPLKSKSDIFSLPKISVKEKLNYVADAIKLLKKELNKPLIGFSGAPFTLASYMIEGRSSKTLKNTKKWMIQDPESFHNLLNQLTSIIIEYVHMQIDAGVDAIQIFDSWTNVLSFKHFNEFSKNYLSKISAAIKKHNIPSILFCRGSSYFAQELASCTPSAISLDWNADISHIRKEINPSIALQGNLDPDLLYASPEVLKKEINSILKNMDQDPSYIFNLGHGIAPDVPVESVRILVETVKEYEVKNKTQQDNLLCLSKS